MTRPADLLVTPAMNYSLFSCGMLTSIFKENNGVKEVQLRGVFLGELDAMTEGLSRTVGEISRDEDSLDLQHGPPP